MAQVQAIGRELMSRIPRLGEMQQARRGEDVPADQALRRVNDPEAEAQRTVLHMEALNVIVEAALVQARPPGPDDVLWIVAAVEERRNNYPDIHVDDFLRALILAHQDVWEETSRIVEELNADPGVLSPVGSLLFEWSATIATQIMSVYRRAEFEAARDDERRRSRLLHRVLSGELVASVKDDELLLYGIAPSRKYVAFRGRSKTANDTLEAGLLEHVAAHGGLVGLVGGDVAGIAPQPPSAPDVDGIVGIGPPRQLTHIAESFRLATSVLETGEVLGMGGVVSLDELGVDLAIHSEGDVSDYLETKYVQPLRALGAFGDVLLESLHAFVENRLNVERTARALFVHPNTLRHRLDRFEEVTGARLEDMDDIFAVWWAIRRSAAQRLALRSR